MAQEIIKELITEAGKDFALHLDQDDNERILFSGRFGKGKTTFLKYFFEHQPEFLENEKYDAYFIDPVNYTVASNEDIIRYLKYDILLCLLEKQKNVADIEFTWSEALFYYLATHPVDTVKNIVKYIPKVGKELTEVWDDIEKLYEKIKELKVGAESATESARLVKFLKEIESDQYSIYESDIITEFIRELLKRPSGSDPVAKKSVLIIDNLDRIDPDHIFRLLNVFSAHMDYKKDNIQVNKFFFDKVIIVCDLRNIQSIFSNRYGKDVDFSGYLDKFYSKKIFRFQNYSQLSRVCHVILRNLRIGMSVDKLKPINDLKSDHGIFNLITTLVHANSISLRSVLNFTTEPFICKPYYHGADFGLEVEPWKTPVVEMQILVDMTGGYHQLYATITRLKEDNASVGDYYYNFISLLYFDMRHLHNYRNSKEVYSYQLGDKTLEASLHIERRELRDFTIRFNPTSVPIDYKPGLQDFYSVYLKVLRELHVSKIIE